MKRSHSAFIYLAFLLLLGCTTSVPQKRPNILLILADDMGYSDLGCYGSEIHTPNLDRLAEQGIRFTQFYNTAKCAPTRASLLTGLYHQQSKLLRDTNNNVTIAEVLRSADYYTIMCGKWHLGKHEVEEGTPVERGFDRFFGFLSGCINYYTAESHETGKTDMHLGKNNYDVPEDFYSTDAFTDFALEFLKEGTKEGNPFFLYLSYNAPHFPLQVPESEIEKYREKYIMGWDSLRKRRYERMIQMGIIDPKWELSSRDSIVPAWESLSQQEKEDEQLLMATYAAMIDRMDQQIGRLLDYLDQQGISENTMIVFLSDNGACPYDFNYTPSIDPGPANSFRTYDSEWANASNTPFRLYKQWIHEGGISAPMIVRWPEMIEPGSMTHVPAQLIDIMPTLLEAAGSSYPDTYRLRDILPMEGKSLIPVLMGEEINRNTPLFWEYNGSRAVRKGPWKLVAERGQSWELYNLNSDRTETYNLIKDHPKMAEELSNLYDQWANRIGTRTNEEAFQMEPSQQDRYLFESENKN